MRKLMSLVLLLVVFGMSVASAAPAGWYARPLPNLQSASVDRPGMLVPWVRVALRFFVPFYGYVQPKYSAPPGIIPNPPVCGAACLLLPVQAIAR
jgi:hypothetical protein